MGRESSGKHYKDSDEELDADGKEERNYSSKKLSWPQEVEQATNAAFGGWGAYVARNPCKVFWLAFLVYIALSSGMRKI
jgi:hypothetical protein